MPTSFAVGFSQSDDPKEAAHQASVAVKNQLNSIATDFVMVLGSPTFINSESLETIHTILKPKKLIGSSSLGIIVSSGFYSRGIAILGCSSPDYSFSLSSMQYKSQEDFRKLGYEFSRQMVGDYKSPLPRRMSLIFYDPYIPYKKTFALGARDVLGQNLKTMGAFSCDDFKSPHTFQVLNKQTMTKSINGFILGSEHDVYISNTHGFKPLGKPRYITSGKENILHTIDNKPAISIYEEFLKKEAHEIRFGFFHSAAAFYPLGFYYEPLGQYLLRYPMEVLADGSLVFQEEIPLKTEIHLMISNKESCKHAANMAAIRIKNQLGKNQPQVLIVLNSVTKNKILGRNSFVELEAIRQVLGTSVPVIGMYSLGEIANFKTAEQDIEYYLQNGSLSIIAIS